MPRASPIFERRSRTRQPCEFADRQSPQRQLNATAKGDQDDGAAAERNSLRTARKFRENPGRKRPEIAVETALQRRFMSVSGIFLGDFHLSYPLACDFAGCITRCPPLAPSITPPLRGSRQIKGAARRFSLHARSAVLSDKRGNPDKQNRGSSENGHAPPLQPLCNILATGIIYLGALESGLSLLRP